MKTNFAIAGAIALASIAAVAVPANAGTDIPQVGLASFAGGTSTAFTYTSGLTGTNGLTVNRTVGFTLISDIPGFTPSPVTAYLTLTGLGNDGAATSSNGTLSQNLKSGTFEFTSGKNGAGTDYLSGSISGADVLSGPANSHSASYTDGASLDVTYSTSSTFFAGSGLVNPGSFYISFLPVNPTLSLDTKAGSGGTLNSFKAGGTGQFSAAPEPSQFGMMALMGLGLTGLIVRARKARTAAGLAA